MKKENFDTALFEQYEELITNKGLNETDYEYVLEQMDDLIAIQHKIKLLKEHKEERLALIQEYMERNNLSKLYSPNGTAKIKKSDITSIKKDLVLMVIDEFKCGERDNLEFEDVSETRTCNRFTIRAISKL